MLQQLLHSEGQFGRHGNRMSPALRRGAIISGALHAAILAALLIGLPVAKPPEPPEETTVAMVFQGTAASSMQAPTPAPKPSPANAPQNAPAPPVTQPPTKQVVEAPPPPPPPPPPPQAEQAPSPPTPTPPKPVPPPTPAPAPPTPPPPTQQTPPKPNPPQEAQPLPLPPPPAPPPPAPPSATSQPNPTTNPAANSQALQNTLEKLRQLVQQRKPPTAQYNPREGGPQNGGGNPLSNDTAALSASQRGAIGDHVRACWTYDAGAPGVDKMRVMLQVTTDANGTARIAHVVGDDQARLSDPVFRAFADRARNAVLDPRCANLPLPANMLGKNNILTFRFSP